MLSAAIAVAACSATPAPKKKAAVGGDFENGDDGEKPLPPAPPPDYENVDSGAFGRPDDERPRDASSPKPDGSRGPLSKDGGTSVDASIPGDDDAGITKPEGGVVTPEGGVVTAALCPGPLAKGDLAIVEMMITSVSGSGDRGEWVEIQSTRDCVLNIKGLRVESPRGAEFDFVEVTEDMLVQPNGTFVVADTIVDSMNNKLPGVVLSWIGTDTLKNDGDSVTVKAGTTVIDQLTYGSWGSTFPGRSVSFSVDCTWPERSDWDRWTWSTNAWTTGFMGTPNTDNSDIACY